VVSVGATTLEAVSWDPLRHGVFEIGARVLVSCDPASLRPLADDDESGAPVPGPVGP